MIKSAGTLPLPNPVSHSSDGKGSLCQIVNVRAALHGDVMCVVRGQQAHSETCF